jgi:hypothetical protein
MPETLGDATSVVHKRPGALCLGGLLPLKPSHRVVPPRASRIVEPERVMLKVLLAGVHAEQLAAVLDTVGDPPT